MFYHLLIAVTGIVGLVGIWVGVQTLVRRGSPGMDHDTDVLACRSCGTPDACHGCVQHTDNQEYR